MTSSSAERVRVGLLLLLLLLLLSTWTAAAAAQDGADEAEAGATGAQDASNAGWRAEPEGELQLRLNALSDVPLRPLPRDTDGSSGELGQNLWLSSWLRLGGQLRYDDTLRFVAQIDVLDGVIAGDVTQGVSDAQRPRDERDFYRTVQPRWLFVEWRTPYLMLQAGQMGSHWGLGMLANDGTRDRPFGDHEHGDVVERIAVATTPLGEGTPWFVAGGADLVFQDSSADLLDDELAVQGFVATWYQQPDLWVGFYGVHRQQWNELDDHTSLWVLDGYGRVDRDMLDGKAFTAFEVAVILGETEAARTRTHPEHDVQQLLGVVQVGWEQELFGGTLEAGWASGDDDAEDDTIRRGSFDEDFDVGLVLFPEVLAWHSARAAAWARSEDLVGRPARGSDSLPTDGAVAGAAYLFPHARVTPLPWLEARLGAIFAWSTAAAVDPYRQRAYSENVGWLGGDPTRRYLGTEIDAAVLARHTLVEDELVLTGGLEGGVLLPGPAFDDADGSGLDPIGLARAKVGLEY